jgi:opacity protein-like surface antigen
MWKYTTLASVLVLLPATAMADGKDSMLSEKDAPVYHATRSVSPGLYVGATIGYGSGTSTASYDEPDNHPGAINNDPSGVLGGVTVGYNWRYTDKWLVGVEADLSAADMTGNEYMRLWDGHRWRTGWGSLITARARAGYDFSGNLLYGTAGIAAVYSAETIEGDNDNDQSQDNRGWRAGWVAGVGVERMITDRLSGKVEYLHVGLTDKDGWAQNNNDMHRTKFENDIDIFRVGLNYKVH